MWSLFDYASVSVTETAAKPSIDPSLADTAGNKPGARQQISPERSSTSNSNGEFSKSLSASDLPQPPDAAPSGGDSTLFDPEAFSDLPEEWILDDWTLFGAPLSAYHSGFES
jgi:hypothetical protein